MTTTKTQQVSANRIGTAALISAALLVGLAIAADGALARALNGIGGVLWVGAAGVIAWSHRRSERRRVGAVVTLASALLLAVFVRPSDAVLAAAGFTAAGALTALVVGSNGSLWARLIPAIWLPAHLVVAVGRVVVRDAAGAEPLIRTEPPPTAAIVPLVMVLAAWGGGEVIDRWRERRESTSHQPGDEPVPRSPRGAAPSQGEGAL